jgi:hypothetical protein
MHGRGATAGRSTSAPRGAPAIRPKKGNFAKDCWKVILLGVETSL